MKKDVLISDYCEPGSVRMQMQMQKLIKQIFI